MLAMTMPIWATRYKLCFFVPPSSLENCKSALFAIGAGTYPGGKYTHASFETTGTGQFKPEEGAVPNIGEIGKLQRVQEVKCEVLCVGVKTMKQAVEELKK